MTGTGRRAPRVQRGGSQSQMKAEMPPKSAAQHCPTVTSKHFLLAEANHATENIIGVGGTARAFGKGCG